MLMITVIVTLTVILLHWMLKFSRFNNISEGYVKHFHLYKCISCRQVLHFGIPTTIDPIQRIHSHLLLLTTLVNKCEDHIFTHRILEELDFYKSRIDTYLKFHENESD